MKNLIRSVQMLLLLTSAILAKTQVPVLNSFPSATAVIFLDFDGQTVDNTSWNTSGPIYCNPSGLTNSQVTEIFNRVSEDYRPFNINITTDSTVYWAAPAAMRMRVILTVSSSWYGSAGGVSFVGSFTWGDNTPAFVFTALLNYNSKNIAEATSHEVGHTLGLYHQALYDTNCNKISDYNSGKGTGEIAWAPIMGVGYSKNFTLWNNGPNSFGCTNYQSDLDVITSVNGFTYRDDDHSGSFADAAITSFTNNQFNVNGIIERNTDQDMFQFSIPSFGEFTLNAIPYNVGTGDAGSDLDIQVSLYDYTQKLINIYNPSTLLSSVIDTSLSAGIYYLKIEGKGNIYAPNYASLGSYSLNGGFVANAPLALRKLELHGTVNNDKHELNWLIDADEKVVTQILEISTDGIHFSSLVQPGNSVRSYNYIPTADGTIQYRLNVSFDNGRQYYSNVVALKQNSMIQRPRLAGNLIISGIITVNSPGNFTYMIFDLNGKTTHKGLLTNGANTINSQGLKNGMYIIRFANMNQQWTDKFVVQ
ncbi:MAG: T9SS type A sorting domain-containing protein [Bacteroidetes bacterium]|nr:T9SS type A sorting domain-containing protein [Bacteroidota bacterium]MBS1931355.1 T9SS type A sorting domain-containing protein [Bacteroidota bacterium]